MIGRTPARRVALIHATAGRLRATAGRAAPTGAGRGPLARFGVPLLAAALLLGAGTPSGVRGGEAEQPVLDIARVNAMDRAAFVAVFGGIFEHSPWVAERAFSAIPFAGPAALHAAMMAALRAAPAADRLRLLNAHPNLAGPEA